MSKYSNLSPCPFCGSDVEMSGDYVFQCTNGACDAQIIFCNRYYTINPQRAAGAFNRRASCGAFTYVLIGASIMLIIAVFLAAFCVTERAQNVSHETIAPQAKTVQAAAQPERIAGDDIEAAGYAARIYTDADAQALAQMAWGESRGVESLSVDGVTVSAECQQAAAMWCALNRYDAGFEGDSVAEIVAAPRQFHGYAADHPVDDGFLALAYDVLERWQAEKNGGSDVGRVLPEEYVFFVGDGINNHFSTEYGSDVFYTWELLDVYAED